MHFEEYELFPGLIGLSPLPTAHRKTFQRLAGSVLHDPCYRITSTWPWVDHAGFASSPTNYFALFRLAFASVAPAEQA